MDRKEADSYNTATELFAPLCSREYYRTEGFNELALGLATKMSYRETTAFLNRVRWETDAGTPMRTVAYIVEQEGLQVQETRNDLAELVLAEHHFDREGTPQAEAALPASLAPEKAGLPPEHIAKAMEDYNRDKAEGYRIAASAALQLYENPRDRTCID